MLRLAPYTYHRPRTVVEAVDLLGARPGESMLIAGGTDLVPNLKHRLFHPEHLVALKGIAELGGIEERAVQGGSGEAGGTRELVIGAAETLSSVAAHPLVRSRLPALADAAGHVAGPQLRNMGTIGGNLCLDTRCTYYNQTEFWRSALGYCLKKDGTVCHVTQVGKKCVAAHSADTPPVLMAVGAVVDLVGPEGSRTLPVADLFVADGIWNSRRQASEILTRIRIPVLSRNTRTAYIKLRQRNAIDFPLLTLAAAAQMDEDGRVQSISVVATGLGSRPRALSGLDEVAVGRPLSPEVVEAVAERAHAQCHPLENMIVDADWRHAMVPVYTRRLLQKLIEA